MPFSNLLFVPRQIILKTSFKKLNLDFDHLEEDSADACRIRAR